MRRTEQTIIVPIDSKGPHEFVAVGEAEEWVEITVGERCRCHHDCHREGIEASALLHIDDLKALVAVVNQRIAAFETGGEA